MRPARERGLRRRDALAGALGAGAGLVVGGPLTARAQAPQQDQKELSKAALTGALRLEQTALVAFEAIANAGPLGGSATAMLRDLLDQDRQHADQLAAALDGLGAKQPIPPRRADIPGLAAASRERRAALRFAIALEERTIGAYGIVARDVRDANVLRTSAGAMGTDGQHLVILRELIGARPVPSAFERGTRP